MDMLCIAAAHDPIGYVSINGRALTADDIARMAGVGLPEGQALLSELERNGVFSRDRYGTIFSRRLVKDEKKAKIARKNGKNGGNPTLGKQKGSSPSVNPPDKPPDKGRVNTQEPRARNQKKETDSPSSVSPTPRERDGPTDDEIFRQLGEAAAGNVAETAFIRPILDLISMGCDFETHILPVVRASVPKLKTPLKSWGCAWLRDEIISRAKTIQKVPPPENQRKIKLHGGCEWTEENLRFGIERWKNNPKTWFGNIWGPPPDRSEVIRKFAEDNDISLEHVEESA
jgi:hypothetical protein